MVDMILGYACNARCVFCTTGDDLRGVEMSTGEAESRLLLAIRAHRPRKVRFGGGEPTIRTDLGYLVDLARREGVPKVSVQTNGFMFADPGFVARMKQCGLGRVNVSVKARTSALCDSLTSVRGAHALAEPALRRIAAAGMELEIDVLLVNPVLDELRELTRACGGLGARGINYWFPSHEGRALGSGLIPKMTDAARVLRGIFSDSRGMTLRVFYMPYCFFPRDRARVWHPVVENALVITPGGEFFLEKGRVDIGVTTPRCGGCAAIRRCFGVRENYLALYGDGELAPLAPGRRRANARASRAPVRRALRR